MAENRFDQTALPKRGNGIRKCPDSGQDQSIGGIAAVCAVIPGLQGAAAFAGGVYLGGTLAMELAN